MLLATWLNSTLDILSWILVVLLILTGVLGTIVPILPGSILIFLGALAHYFFLGPENSLELPGLIILAILVGLSFLVDFLSGVIGAKWFGASKWGAGGALAGGVVGIFFSLPGLIIGPIIGAILFELIFAKKEIKPATKSGWGTVVGATAGLVGKVIIAVWMVGWIIFDMFFFHP